MSDHGSAGRMVSLVPITWDNGFPLIGLPGNLRKAPNTWIKPNTGYTQEPKPAFIHDDNFDSGKLNPHWQWNHVPDDTKWSLTEKPGVLRLHSLPADDFYSRPQQPLPAAARTRVHHDRRTGHVGPGRRRHGGSGAAEFALCLDRRGEDPPKARRCRCSTTPAAAADAEARRRGSAHQCPHDQARPIRPTHLWLRVHCNFDTDEAIFSWSADGKEFTPLGKPFTMTFQLTTFQGVRPALFNYNTSGQPGGYADFDNYTVDEPRARGIEREIPMGKTITLTSGADGSFLAADTQNNTLVNVAADPSERGRLRTRSSRSLIWARAAWR